MAGTCRYTHRLHFLFSYIYLLLICFLYHISRYPRLCTTPEHRIFCAALSPVLISALAAYARVHVHSTTLPPPACKRPTHTKVERLHFGARFPESCMIQEATVWPAPRDSTPQRSRPHPANTAPRRLSALAEAPPSPLAARALTHGTCACAHSHPTRPL
jgi:hypothetical protein